MYKKRKRIKNNDICKPICNFLFIFGVLFILALKASSPETSRQGNFFGILGMIIAITVTFLSTGNFSQDLSLCSYLF